MELDECPIRAAGTSPTSARTSVSARPPRDLTPNRAVVTTAAMMVTASHARPVSMSVMKYTRARVNSASPESPWPATSE